MAMRANPARVARAPGKGSFKTPPGGMRATPEPIQRAPQTIEAGPTLPPRQTIATPQPVSHEPASGIHPLMVSSLPSIASGADVYARQFYRGTTVPYRRYLPVTLK